MIVDGADNFPTRYLLNDASVKLEQAGRPRLDLPLRGPGHRLRARATGRATAASIPEPPPPELAPSCAEAGVLGVLPGIIGSLQAIEAVKLLLGIGEPLVGRLLLFDALAEGEDEVLGERVQQREGELVMVVAPVHRVLAEIDQGVIHPAHVPFEIEAEPAQVGRGSHAGQAVDSSATGMTAG